MGRRDALPCVHRKLRHSNNCTRRKTRPPRLISFTPRSRTDWNSSGINVGQRVSPAPPVDSRPKNGQAGRAALRSPQVAAFEQLHAPEDAPAEIDLLHAKVPDGLEFLEHQRRAVRLACPASRFPSEKWAGGTRCPAFTASCGIRTTARAGRRARRD